MFFLLSKSYELYLFQQVLGQVLEESYESYAKVSFPTRCYLMSTKFASAQVLSKQPPVRLV